MRLGARQRGLISAASPGALEGMRDMGRYGGAEIGARGAPPPHPVEEESLWHGASDDGEFDLSAEQEALHAEWKQPELSDDAHRCIVALYDEYRPRLYRYLRSLGLRRDWADEVIQETFMRLTVRLLAREEIRNVQAWVIRVSHNLAIDVHKKERGEIGGDENTEFLILNRADPSSSPEEAYARSQQMEQMELALSVLKPQQRQCFRMRAHGFRYKDIGLALGISEQRAAFVVKQAAVRLAAICG